MESEIKKTREFLTNRQKRYIRFKRMADCAMASVGMIILSPLLVGISVAIKLDSPGPILFKQDRVGKDKKLFKIWKFRTMRIDTPKDMPTHLLHNPEKYITKVGEFLRKTSLDELPQIWQIVTGKMSIVGPRPALWNQYDLIEERDKGLANKILPGLTGWAQTHGRDELEIDMKAKLDNYYADNIGLGIDVRCFFMTFTRVLHHDGVVEGCKEEDINARKEK